MPDDATSAPFPFPDNLPAAPPEAKKSLFTGKPIAASGAMLYLAPLRGNLETHMRRTRDALRFVSIVTGALFFWSVAAEMDVLPALITATWWRWQFPLLMAVVFWVTADRLAELRCRCCGARDVLVRALFTRSRELLCERCLRWNPSLETHRPQEAPQALSLKPQA